MKVRGDCKHMQHTLSPGSNMTVRIAKNESTEEIKMLFEEDIEFTVAQFFMNYMGTPCQRIVTLNK